MKDIETDDIVMVYDRCRFAVPVKGMVEEISDKDGALKINFSLHNMGMPNIIRWNGYYFHYQQCRWPDGSVIDNPLVVSFMDDTSIAMKNALDNLQTKVVKPWTIQPEEETPFPPSGNVTINYVDEECTPEEDILDGAEDKRTDPLYDGKIGYIPFAYHLIPRRGLAKLAAVMRCGERKGRRDFEWMDIPVEEHVNHAISHLIAYMARKGGIHLANAACRVLMALDLDKEEDLPFPVYNPENKDDLRSDGAGKGDGKGPTIPSP